MLSFFIGVLLSLNVITLEQVPNLSKEEVKEKIETHAPEYMSDWDWSDEV
tara:strand:+ start:1031 stop:1180 length:150 start_codon:yes stop_codon:yes gene_type:complete